MASALLAGLINLHTFGTFLLRSNKVILNEDILLIDIPWILEGLTI